MQVGDLVELSAYGKTRHSFHRLHDHHGVVIKHWYGHSRWKIHWLDKLINIMNRKDIKHVKIKSP